MCECFIRPLEEITAYQKAVTDDFVWEAENLQADESEKRGDIHLPENFRLLRNLVGLVNLVFQHTMGEATLNEFEVAYEPLIKGRANDVAGDVEILIGTKAPTGNAGKDQRTEEPVYDGENDLIAGRIRHLIGTKATIWEPGGGGEKPREIRYGDIAILIRSRTRLPEIETALLKGNIPYKITGGVGFYQRQEIYDIGNYLQFLANPQDDVALVGVLRAPFFGIFGCRVVRDFTTASIGFILAKSPGLWRSARQRRRSHAERRREVFPRGAWERGRIHNPIRCPDFAETSRDLPSSANQRTHPNDCE